MQSVAMVFALRKCFSESWLVQNKYDCHLTVVGNLVWKNFSSLYSKNLPNWFNPGSKNIKASYFIKKGLNQGHFLFTFRKFSETD